MISEFVVLIMLTISLTQSSLSMSLCLVMISLVTSYWLIAPVNLVLAFMFILVFIGGLLILLVTVASLSKQEQNMPMSSLLFVFMSFASFFIWSLHFFTEISQKLTFLTWLSCGGLSILCTLYILGLSLLVITNIIVALKGMIRTV